jgi:hypothetical protein
VATLLCSRALVHAAYSTVIIDGVVERPRRLIRMAVPQATLIFAKRGDLSLILLPILFYHVLELFVNGLLAN